MKHFPIYSSNQSVSIQMLKRIAAPFVFGFVYFVGLIATRYIWHIEDNDILYVAIGLLGILLAF